MLKELWREVLTEGITSSFSLDYKNVVHGILGAVFLYLPICISHKHPILINLFLAYQKINKIKEGDGFSSSIVSLSLHLSTYKWLHICI